MRPVLRKDPRTMIDLDIGKGEIELKHLIYEFEKAEQFVKVDGRKKKSSAICFIYGGTNKKATLINDFSLSKKQSNQAKKLSEEFIHWKKDGMEKEVILGAIAEYLESLNDEHN